MTRPLTLDYDVTFRAPRQGLLTVNQPMFDVGDNPHYAGGIALDVTGRRVTYRGIGGCMCLHLLKLDEIGIRVSPRMQQMFEAVDAPTDLGEFTLVFYGARCEIRLQENGDRNPRLRPGVLLFVQDLLRHHPLARQYELRGMLDDVLMREIVTFLEQSVPHPA